MIRPPKGAAGVCALALVCGAALGRQDATAPPSTGTAQAPTNSAPPPGVMCAPSPLTLRFGSENSTPFSTVKLCVFWLKTASRVFTLRAP